ncbi:MAG: PQQ-binding-like beta-propeller repeat protein [Spirochaetia bacterium]|jgi:outer membrane protein assembly factor BamB|nr:PQQ-binding-like beta-propeller repeat protein [Spirochaetia bacterium]
MKTFSRKIFFSLISLGLLLLLINSCSKKESADVKPALPKEEIAIVQVNEVIKDVQVLTPVAQPEYKEGIITFFSGDVSIFDEGNWYEAEIGDLVTENNSIKVESDSYCEVQFGETAVIKLQENSEINLAVIDLKPGGANVSIDMKLGNVLCKVQKLASEETFKVKTQTAVCGVRGTEFSISSEEGKETLLAVKEGAVTVLPKSVDVDQLKERVADKGDEIKNIIDKIEKEAPVVKANQEVAISEKLVADTEKSVARVETIVDEISKEQTDAAKKESIKKLETAVDEQQKAVSRTIEPPKEISEKSSENLKQINEMRLIALVPAAAADRTAEPDTPKTPSIKLYKVALETATEGAFIEANGRAVGRNSFSGIYPEGETLKFNITKSGYEPYDLEFKVTEATARLYKIELKKSPEPEIPPQKISIITAKKISFSTDPGDSTIIINNKTAGKGKALFDFTIGDKAVISISRNGYENKTLHLDITPETSGSYSIVLNKKPVDLLHSPFSTKVIGRTAYSEGRIFAADSNGNIYSAALMGGSEWKKETANNPNANSYPVPAGNYLFFTGAKEMLVLEAATGKTYSRMQLDSDSSHMFGKRIVSFKERFIYPKNSSLLISTFLKGASEEIIKLPAESGMTPTLWKDNIVIADIEGNVNIIDPESGSVAKRIKTSAVQTIAMNTAIYGNTGFFANRKGNVASVDLDNGKVNWEYQINDTKVNIFSDLCIGGGNVFIYSGSKIFALDMLNGTEVFQPVEASSAPGAKDGRLYYGTAGGDLIEANAETGRILNTVNLKYGTVTTRPVFAENRIIAGTSTGKIIVLNPAGF